MYYAAESLYTYLLYSIEILYTNNSRHSFCIHFPYIGTVGTYYVIYIFSPYTYGTYYVLYTYIFTPNTCGTYVPYYVIYIFTPNTYSSYYVYLYIYSQYTRHVLRNLYIYSQNIW